MRFLSVHGSLSQFRTYIGVETADLPALLSVDAGGGTPVLTVIGFIFWALHFASVSDLSKPIRIQRHLICAGFLALATSFFIFEGPIRKVTAAAPTLLKSYSAPESQRLSRLNG